MALETKWLVSKARSVSCTMPGVWRAVAFAKGCAVIFHSPRGCTSVAYNMDISNVYRALGASERETMEAVPLVSSDLREKDSIFGGIDRLTDCIAFVMKTYHPKCIFIASSCIAGVIGDDITMAAEDAENDYGIPVVAVDGGGFLGGEYHDGYFRTLNAIMDRFLKPSPKEEGSVLLLGDSGGPWGQYAKEVKRLLLPFGLTVKWQFPGYVPFEEWPHVTAASLILMLGGQGSTGPGMLAAAERFRKEYGIPCLGEVFPTGWENTCRFIRAVAAWTGKKEKGETLIREEEKKLEESVSFMLPVTEGKKAVIGIGRSARHYDPSDTIRTLRRLHMDIKAIVLYDNLDDKDQTFFQEKAGALTKAPVITGMKAVEKEMESADILLSTHEITNIPVKQLFIPMIATVGAAGELAYMTGLYRLLCRYGKKGGMAYV